MATVNLGRIKPVFRGAYSGSTAYVVDDIVTSGGSSYICIQAHGAGTQAVNQTAYWTQLAAGGTDVGTTITTQGDILYRDGSGLQRLAKGTAAQQLAMNAGATAPEWVTPSSGTVLKIYTKMWAGGTSIAGTTNNGSATAVSNYATPTITPQSASSKFIIFWTVSGSNDDHRFFQVRRNQDSTWTQIGVGHASLGNANTKNDFNSYFNYSTTNSYPSKTNIFYDAPGDASDIYWQLFQEGHGGTFYFGRSHNNSSTAQYFSLNSVTIWEVDGSNASITYDASN